MKITHEIATEILKLRKQGLTGTEIADKLGYGKTTIYDTLKHYDFSKTDTLNGNISDETNYNEKVIEIKTHAEIKTLNDLIEQCEIDLTIWTVEKYICNKWGSINNPSFQVKAWLKKKIPDEIQFPEIKSVNFNIKWHQKTIKQPEKRIKKALVINDTHNGFMKKMYSNETLTLHDRKVWDIILQVASNEIFDTVVFNGDMLDLTDFSDHFIVSPEFAYTTQSALIELSWYISRIRELQPYAKIVYIEGNHEARFMRSIVTNFKSAYGLMSVDNLSEPLISIPKLLNLGSYDIDYIGDYPNGKHWLNDNLACQHSSDTIVTQNGGTVTKVLKTARYSMIIGHIHRSEKATKTERTRNKVVSYTVASPGCGCKIDGTVPATKNDNNWQQGISTTDYTDDGLFNINLHSINNGMAIINNQLVCGVSNIEHIYNDTKWEMFKVEDEL